LCLLLTKHKLYLHSAGVSNSIQILNLFETCIVCVVCVSEEGSAEE
jgi:hypothetical protein